MVDMEIVVDCGFCEKILVIINYGIDFEVRMGD